jgi:phosphoserine phosphatase
MTLTRIVFFDMEGTLLKKEYRLDNGLVAPSAWTLLAERLGPECYAAEEETKKLWVAKTKYRNYLDWMQDTVDIHRRFNLTRAIFLEVINSVEFMPRAETAVARIHATGAKSILITGGFKALADRVQSRLRIHHAFAGCDYFFNELTGHVDHVNLLPADESGKVDFMRLMCREYSVDPADCVFVGDGKNDCDLARAVGFSIAFNAQPELVDVATTSISQPQGSEDFEAVADCIENRFLG